MFEPLVRRVELSFDRAVHRLSGASFTFLLLAISLAFATAAANNYATELFGEKQAHLILAGTFAVLALFAYAYDRSRAQREEVRKDLLLEQSRSPDPVVEWTPYAAASQALLDGVKAAAPDAARAVIKQIPSNLPLLVGISVGLFLAQKVIEQMRLSEPREM